jgi:hypothetical protein
MCGLIRRKVLAFEPLKSFLSHCWPFLLILWVEKVFIQKRNKIKKSVMLTKPENNKFKVGIKIKEKILTKQISRCSMKLKCVRKEGKQAKKFQCREHEKFKIFFP